MQEKQIALQSKQDSRLHKLVEYIILAAKRRRVVAQSRRHLNHFGAAAKSTLAGGGWTARRQIRNFKFQISKVVISKIEIVISNFKNQPKDLRSSSHLLALLFSVVHKVSNPVNGFKHMS